MLKIIEEQINFIKLKRKKCFYIMQESKNWFNEFFGNNWFFNYYNDQRIKQNFNVPIIFNALTRKN